MNRARHDAEDSRGLADRHHVAGRRVGGRLEAWNIPVPAQAPHLVRGEAFAGRRLASLLIEDAGDDLVGVLGGEAGQEGKRVFIRPNAWGIRTWQREIERRERTASPAKRELRAIVGPRHRDDHFLEERAQEFLAIAIGGRRGGPDLLEIRPERVNVLALLRAEDRRLLVLPPVQFGFRGGLLAEAGFPFGLETSGHEAILRLDHAIPALRAFGIVADAFDFEPPLREGRILMGLELLHREQRRVEGGRCDGVEKGRGHGLVDGDASDVQALDATPSDDVLAGAVVPRCRVSAAIVCPQPTTTVPADGEPL